MSWPGARKVLAAVCVPAADGELAAGVEGGAVGAGGLPEDPHAVASNERHAIEPAAATRRSLSE